MSASLVNDAVFGEARYDGSDAQSELEELDDFESDFEVDDFESDFFGDESDDDSDFVDDEVLESDVDESPELELELDDDDPDRLSFL